MSKAFHCQQMQSLLESGQFSDVTLVVVGSSPETKEQPKEFKVHRALLSAMSPVFSAMFSHTDTKEALEKRVLIEDVSAETMHRMLTYFYTGKPNFEDKKEKSLLEFLAACDKYQVNSLKEECESLLADLVAVDSVCSILQYADLHSSPALKEECFRYIVANSDRVISRSNEIWQQFEATVRSELLRDLLYRLAAKKSDPQLSSSREGKKLIHKGCARCDKKKKPTISENSDDI